MHRRQPLMYVVVPEVRRYMFPPSIYPPEFPPTLTPAIITRRYAPGTPCTPPRRGSSGRCRLEGQTHCSWSLSFLLWVGLLVCSTELLSRVGRVDFYFRQSKPFSVDDCIVTLSALHFGHRGLALCSSTNCARVAISSLAVSLIVSLAAGGAKTRISIERRVVILRSHDLI